MRLASAVRVMVGIIFICAGVVKIPRIAKAVSPDTHQHMTKEFTRYLRVAPFKGMIKITSSQYKQFVGYTELFCGFMLVSGQLVGLASTILAMIMVGAAYTNYKLRIPPAMALTIGLFALLVYISFSHKRKQKQD